MIYLYAKIGELSEEQLDVLVDNLEEEWTEDRDYYLNKSIIDMLQAKGADSRCWRCCAAPSARAKTSTSSG